MKDYEDKDNLVGYKLDFNITKNNEMLYSILHDNIN